MSRLSPVRRPRRKTTEAKPITAPALPFHIESITFESRIPLTDPRRNRMPAELGHVSDTWVIVARRRSDGRRYEAKIGHPAFHAVGTLPMGQIIFNAWLEQGRVLPEEKAPSP